MRPIRNIAIIAHVDHGKTTLVDQILKQIRFFRDNAAVQDCFLDSDDLERERGITILSKNISIDYQGVKINLIDTPGHSDFGGQVERVLKLADGVLLLVDAAEGPMPQTRFVLKKALELGLKPLVIVNKMDKADARPDAVVDKIFDLFVELKANDDQLDFPVFYASGKDGWVNESHEGGTSIEPLMQAIVNLCPPPAVIEGPTQMQVASIDYDNYVGRIGIGRVYRGTLTMDEPLTLIKNSGEKQPVTLRKLLVFQGIDREEREEVLCGDLCAVVGVEGIDVGDTLADAEKAEALPPIHMDDPTVSMIFRCNDSPLYGQEGKFVTSRQLRERLINETKRDVALKLEEIGEAFKVSGRGVLHLAILIEKMRREGYEMGIAPPHVITKEIDGKVQEPMEVLDVDVPEEAAGRAIELVGARRGEIKSMDQHGNRTILEFLIPTRGLIGIRSRLLAATGGEAIMSHLFSHYAPQRGIIPQRLNGVLVSRESGPAVAYAIDNLQQHGSFFVAPGEMCYEGMVVGERRAEGDLIVNIQKAKMLTNMRAAGSDRNLKIAPPVRLSLEESLEYITDDELVEVTPKSIRLRKRLLTDLERRRERTRA